MSSSGSVTASRAGGGRSRGALVRRRSSRETGSGRGLAHGRSRSKRAGFRSLHSRVRPRSNSASSSSALCSLRLAVVDQRWCRSATAAGRAQSGRLAGTIERVIRVDAAPALPQVAVCRRVELDGRILVAGVGHARTRRGPPRTDPGGRSEARRRTSRDRSVHADGRRQAASHLRKARRLPHVLRTTAPV